MPSFDDLLHRHVAASWDKQLALAELLGRHRWTYTSATGTLGFTLADGRRLQVGATVLGSVSTEAGTWLWAWADESLAATEAQMRDALALRALGEDAGVDELTTAEILCDEVDPQALAFVASGALAAQGFYRAPRQGGTVTFLLGEPRLAPRPPRPDVGAVDRVAQLFPRLAAGLPRVHAGRAFVPYLQWYGLDVARRGGTVTGTAADGRAVTATFDLDGTLRGVATSCPSTEAEAPWAFAASGGSARARSR